MFAEPTTNHSTDMQMWQTVGFVQDTEKTESFATSHTFPVENIIVTIGEREKNLHPGIMRRSHQSSRRSWSRSCSSSRPFWLLSRSQPQDTAFQHDTAEPFVVNRPAAPSDQIIPETLKIARIIYPSWQLFHHGCGKANEAPDEPCGWLRQYKQPINMLRRQLIG